MMRRVVTGHVNGKSAFVSDGPAPKFHIFESLPGLGQALAWVTPQVAKVGAGEDAETVTEATSYFPEVGGTSLMYMQVPPQSKMFGNAKSPEEIAAEFALHAPDIAATMEPDNPGMHRTDTIDYVIVLKGEIVLELDDGQEVALNEHDFVVQSGTRHAWHNRSDETVLMAVVVVGAERA